MNKTLSTALLTVFLATSSATVLAEENAAMAPKTAPAAANPMEKAFNKLDANHDGMIDKKEAKHNRALYRSFRHVAKNGKLDKEGYMKWAKKRHHHHKIAKAKAKAKATAKEEKKM